MKKNILSILALGAALSGSVAFAEVIDTTASITIPTSPSVSLVSSVREKAEVMTTQTLARIKARGAQLIRERIEALISTGKVIDQSKTLTTAQKATLNATIATNITGLTTLGTSISAGTEASSTKVLVASIYSTFRIYGIVIPQIRLEKRIYDMQNYSTRLSDIFVKVQTHIDQAKTKGKDVTVWQKSLDDAKVLVATDMNTLSGLLVKASALKPTDYGTSSKATIDQLNVGIKAVAKDFNSIGKTIHASLSMKGDMNLHKKDEEVKDTKDMDDSKKVKASSTLKVKVGGTEVDGMVHGAVSQ